MPSTPAAFVVDDDSLADAYRGTVGHAEADHHDSFPGASEPSATDHSAATGAMLTLSGDEGHHAARVARLKTGERIFLTDAAGHFAHAEVTQVRKSDIDVRLLGPVDPPLLRTPTVSLIQALATGGRDEQAIEAATELGVDRITPWIAARSVSVWKGDKLRKGQERWSKVARAAVKQCRRRGIPQVQAPLATSELVGEVRRRVEEGGVVLVLHEQEHRPLLELTQSLREPGISDITVIVGPEGGIDDAEVSALSDAGAQSVLLGPEVLRASTAGPAAIAVISALIGRWDRPPESDSHPGRATANS